jgi:ribosomal protein S18 acetylase RimI-like enzyme
MKSRGPGLSAREESITWRNPARLLPADAVSPESLRCAVNAACAGVHTAAIEAAHWPAYLRERGVDLSLSALLQRANDILAFALVTQRPHQRTRIALFGTVPSQRGRGFAARLLDEVLAGANARRENSVELEVVAQNHAAMKACWARGFKPLARLHGFSQPSDEPGRAAHVADEGADDPVVTSVSAPEALEWLHDLDTLDPQELPWPVSAAALPQRRSVQAWRCERAQLVFETVAGVKLRVWSLVDRDPEQRGAAQLLATLRAQYPHAMLKTLPVFRQDGAARAFEAMGWRRQAHYQWWLQWALCG